MANGRDYYQGVQENSDELKEEQKHFQRVVKAFLYYKVYATARLKRLQENYDALPPAHQTMLPEMPSHIQRLREAVEVNERFVTSIVSSSVGMFDNSQVSKIDINTTASKPTPSTQFEMAKVLTTVKQFYRDWSSEGKKERDMCYRPIIEELLTHYPVDRCDPSQVSILVPGSGLGRLAYELARCGYTCQGNEFSIYMLLGSNFILNQSSGIHSHVIHPWIHQFSNTWSRDHQLTSVTVPDVDPCDLPRLGLFSMAAGDFLHVYTQPDEWDSVVCCFFIDTAHNVIDYFERIYHILKPGGIWINFGPLLYHYADMPGEKSIELCWKDLRKLISQEIGFEIIMTYDCVFLVARKPFASHTHNNVQTLDSKNSIDSNYRMQGSTAYHEQKLESSVDK